ncbi:peptide ABC transporter substrate-binding protein [Herpetosiphon llansteffanensis]|uniref:peptide ABC transporter substrate-binding protein n=1 Tax=Herpetosiphon llansteffanensis TaxID=2094568 RepID=UPI000D7C0E11|nr:peptide ABC transporter substrate-binding protein [Herpetosiphon llansteffanensis]
MFKRLSIVGLLLTSLVGCAVGNSPTSVPAPAPTPAAQSQAGGGGNFILTLGDDPATIDPALVGDTTSGFIARLMFSGLVTLNNDLEAVPDLAETIDVSADGTVYTFKLRSNTRFADGTPLTAEDVRWSLERATDPSIGSIVSPTYLDDIAGVLEKVTGKASSLSGVKVVDDQTIEITLRQPSSLFLLKLTHPPAFVLDRRTVEGNSAWREKPNGSGPFTLDLWNHRRRMELVPNPYYYGSAPKLDRITYLIGAEGSNPLGLYEQGEIDVTAIGTYDLDRINDAADPLHAELRVTPQLQLSYIGLNVNQPPFDDPKVREAFYLLIDRVKLADVSYNGSVVAARGILPPGMPGAEPERLPEPRADIARAKQLISESSYGSVDKFPPIIGYSSGSGVGLLAQIAKDELGVTIEIRGQDQFGDYLAALERDNYHLYDLSWIADYPDPQNFLEVLFGSNGQYNRTNYSNSQFDQLIEQAKAEADADKRGALYRQAEEQLLSDFVVIPLMHSVDYSLVKSYVDGYTITALGELDLTGVSLKR